MRRITLFMHVSLDGFVAGPNGEMDWIHVEDEIFGYVEKRIEEADTALYGRVTFDMMESYWPTAADQPGASRHDIHHSKWYKQVKKVVLSNSLKGKNLKNVRIISDQLAQEINHLKSEPGKDILIFGSPSAAHSLMNENLIDDYWLFLNPILLGQGVPLFKNIKQPTKLNLKSTKLFSKGVTALHYQL